MRKNPFLLTNTNGKSITTSTNKSFNILNETNLFPELSSIKLTNEINCLENSQKFKDILTVSSENNINTNNDTNINNLEPGFIQIIKTNDKIIINEGPKLTLKNSIKYQTYNDTINDAISEMIRRWTQYEKEYDDLNGEGSYANKFKMQPVYGEEYEYNSDNDSNNENNISDYDEYEYEYEY